MLLLCVNAGAQGEVALTRSEQAVINVGFATQLGSGVYSLSGRTLQVYKLPFNYEFPASADARVKVRLTMPVTIGFIDFKPRDVIDSGLPQPFVEAGLARDRTNELDQRVYAAGLRSYFEIGRSTTDWQLYNELIHVVVEQKSPDSMDDFTRFRTGATERWRLWGIPLPRVGLGYRFGEGLSVYRLVLGSPY